MLQIRYKNGEKGALWLVEPKYTFGASEDADIKLASGADAVALHATLSVQDNNLSIDAHGNPNVLVNGYAVTETHSLKEGDSFIVGATEFQVFDPKSTLRRKVTEPVVKENKWYLKALSTALADQTYPLAETSILGRSKECDISLNLVHLSRKHARLTVSQSGLEIRDLESSNGTFVNGERVDHAELKPGDELSFDTLRFRVHGPEESENMTVMRPTDEEASLTTVRPALSRPDVKASLKNKDTDKPRAPQEKARPSTSEQAQKMASRMQPQTTTDERKRASNQLGWIILAGVFVAFGAYAVYSGIIPIL